VHALYNTSYKFHEAFVENVQAMNHGIKMTLTASDLVFFYFFLSAPLKALIQGFVLLDHVRVTIVCIYLFHL
jgi:hypothetical protein